MTSIVAYMESIVTAANVYSVNEQTMQSFRTCEYSVIGVGYWEISIFTMLPIGRTRQYISEDGWYGVSVGRIWVGR